MKERLASRNAGGNIRTRLRRLAPFAAFMVAASPLFGCATNPFARTVDIPVASAGPTPDVVPRISAEQQAALNNKLGAALPKICDLVFSRLHPADGQTPTAMALNFNDLKDGAVHLDGGPIGHTLADLSVDGTAIATIPKKPNSSIVVAIFNPARGAKIRQADCVAGQVMRLASNKAALEYEQGYDSAGDSSSVTLLPPTFATSDAFALGTESGEAQHGVLIGQPGGDVPTLTKPQAVFADNALETIAQLVKAA